VNVLIVSGIWPPDVGGPASHAPEIAAYLLAAGHQVEVVVTADQPPAAAGYPIYYVSRRIPVGARHLAVSSLIARHARSNDVVYATSMLGRASVASAVVRRPLVVKLVADEAYERARRRGLFHGDLNAFQEAPGDLRIRALRRARDAGLRRVDHLVSPSAYLARLAVTWGVPPERVTTLPNPAPVLPSLASREELREQLGFVGPTLAFAGRITRQKALGVALAAVKTLDGVNLVIAGDGPDLPAVRNRALELGLGERVRFVGALSRQGVLELFRASDASVISSEWENFPHTVVEALAAGTPVIATAVGGVAEIVSDGENGLLVPPGDATALAEAIGRFLADDELSARLRAAAAPSVEQLRPEIVYRKLELILISASHR